MISLKRILRDYEDSGAVHALVSIQTALDGGVFATKSGDLMAVLALRGPDYECLDSAELNRIARVFEAGTRIFDERFRLYQHLLKRETPAIPTQHYADPVVRDAIEERTRYLAAKSQTLHSLDAYLTVVFEGWRPEAGWRARLTSWAAGEPSNPRGSVSTQAIVPPFAFTERLSTEDTLGRLERSLEMARETLTNKVASFALQLRDAVRVDPLDSEPAFRFFRRLLNYSPYKTDSLRLKYNDFVDFQACDSALECHRDFLRLDDDYVQVLTLKDPPTRTFAQMLRVLTEIPCNYVIASEWKRHSPIAMRRLIQSKRRHFHNSKASLMNYVNSGKQNGPSDMLIDDGAVAMVGNLGACLEELEVNGRAFGEFSLSIVLYHCDEGVLRRAASQCFKVLANHDAQLTDERGNRLNAWLATFPGNSAYNLRKLWLLDSNYADLSFLTTLQNGNARNEHLDAEYLTVFEGSAGVPYFFNLHCKDVAHTLVLGATGSGKSFLLNFLLTHAQKYTPFTAIFDLGGSYQNLTRLFGGSYLQIGVEDRPFTINPFCLEPSKTNLLFLFSFVKVLIQSSGYAPTGEEERDLYEQIENLYSIAPEQRRLLTLSNILSRNLRGPLQKWVQGGPYASLFDNARDNLTLARFQTFDFEGMDKAADQLEPLLFYILHRANAVIYDAALASSFKVFVMDEAWRFFRNPVIKSYIIEAFKTWRKKNAAMILATQSAEDLLASDLLPVVVESCPTKLFLANPGMDAGAYRAAFHLNETETELIARLVPKLQVLVKQPGESKLLHLNVGPKEYWLYTNSPMDNERRRQVFERHGFKEGLEILARGGHA